MDGRNSNGRRISLLNEGGLEWAAPPPPPTATATAPARTSSSAGRTSHSLPFHSRASSFTSRSASSRNLSHSSTSHTTTTTTSKPNSGPPTPQLMRSGSSDSAEMQRTPSPLTPDLNYGIEGLAVGQKYADPATAFVASSPYHTAPVQRARPVQQYGPVSSDRPPPLPMTPFHAPSTVGQKRSMYSAPPSPLDDPCAKQLTCSTTFRSGSRSAGPSKKNHYPCPLARQYNCQDYFTTSGHAARHAKKHTGRKDALCPECNKAFTRKDNMEQHRRTHQTSRKLPKDLAHFAVGAKRAKSISKTAKPLAPLTSPLAESAEPLPLSPSRSYSGYADAAIGLAPQPYPDLPGQNGYGYANPAAYYDTAPLTGLDTLAIAASADDARSP